MRLSVIVKVYTATSVSVGDTAPGRNKSVFIDITEADETNSLESVNEQQNISGHTRDFVTCNGQLTKARLVEVFKPLLAADALLVSDANFT